jgi:single-stranded-DNA-specific exonuclease
VLKDVTVPGLQVFDWRGTRSKLEKLAALDGEASVRIVSFRPQGQRQLEQQVQKWLTLQLEPNPEIRQLVLYDLPRSYKELEDTLSVHPELERLYCLFGEEPNALSSLPSREQFKEVYKTVYLHKSLLRKDIPLLAQAKKLTPSAVLFILEVFHDLDFLKKDEQSYQLSQMKQKRDLTESIVYQRQKEALELETELLYSSYQSLRAFLKRFTLQDAGTKEKVYHGF